LNSSSPPSGVLSLEQIVERLLAYQPAADVDAVRRAYEYASAAHQGQKRKSGEPYFSHPASVAGVITELRLDVAVVVAGLLHDVAEDTSRTIQDIRRLFGKDVAFLVDGVTKLSKIDFSSRQDREAENFNKMVVAMCSDIRVLLLKLCDRVDNMRTLEFMKPDAQERIARETMEIFAPLAGRLGIHRFKSELEDLAFRYLEPEAFKHLDRMMTETQPARDRFARETSETLRQQLRDYGINVDVTFRVKHLYSIQRQMLRLDLDFSQLRDIVAFRVVLDSVPECYSALGAIHSGNTPVPGRIKDHIALPKPNMYQAIHTTVIVATKGRLDIQICTKAMERVADEGIAANWVYGSGMSGGADPSFEQRFTWLRDLMKAHSDIQDAAEFIESVKLEVIDDEVYVFTPKGDARVFPQGATAIDFAYAIHSEIGHHCAGARVNGSISALNYKLRSGDTVDILTKSDQCPKKEWLDFATTSRARNRIRAFLRTDERERSMKLGRDLLEKELHSHSISMQRFMNNESEVRRVLESLHIPTLQDLFVDINYGKIALATVTRMLTIASNDDRDPEPVASVREGRIEHLVRRVTGRDRQTLTVGEIDDYLVRYARCCNPMPGDEIAAFVTRSRGFTVHRRDCPKVFETDPDRRIAVEWSSRVKTNRPVQLKVHTADKPGVLASLGTAFSEQNINLKATASHESSAGRSVCYFTFLCSDLAQLRVIMRALRTVDGVLSVERA